LLTAWRIDSSKEPFKGKEPFASTEPFAGDPLGRTNHRTLLCSLESRFRAVGNLVHEYRRGIPIAGSTWTSAESRAGL
jgi:hypothetical protein